MASKNQNKRRSAAKKGSGHRTLEEYEAALRRASGFVTGTAQILGVTAGAVSKRIKRSKRLQKIRKEIREQVSDVAESKLMTAIEKGQAWAVCFWLKTQAKDRGYIEKPPLQQKDGAQPVKVKWVDPPGFQASDDRVDVSRLELGQCTLEDLGLEGNGAAGANGGGGRVKGSGDADD